MSDGIFSKIFGKARKSSLENFYRDSYKRGFIPGDVVEGVSDPNVIFGKIRAKPLEELLVARLSPDDYLRKDWHAHMTNIRRRMWSNVFLIGGYTIQAGVAAALVYFTYTRNPMTGQSAVDLCYDFVKAAAIVGFGGGMIHAFLRNPGYTSLNPKEEYLDDFASEEIDLSKFRTDLSNLEAPIDVVKDGNISYGKRYLESNNEVSS